MKELFEVLKEFISFPICLVFVLCLQIVKKLLAINGIKFKKSGNWLWVTLLMGFPLALIANGLTNFEGYNMWRFIIQGFAYAGGATVIYSVIKKIKLNRISELFSNDT